MRNTHMTNQSVKRQREKGLRRIATYWIFQFLWKEWTLISLSKSKPFLQARCSASLTTWVFQIPSLSRESSIFGAKQSVSLETQFVRILTCKQFLVFFINFVWWRSWTCAAPYQDRRVDHWTDATAFFLVSPIPVSFFL